LKGLPVISTKLIEHGLSADTPAALIEQGTTLSQKIYCATISTLPGKMKAVEVKPPTLLIVGSVVSLHEKLDWFHPSPDDGDAAPSIGAE